MLRDDVPDDAARELKETRPRIKSVACSFLRSGFGANRSEGFDAFADAEHVPRELQPAALFENRDHLVKLRPGVRARQHDANWVKQFLPFCSRFRFHFVHNRLETLWGELVLAGRVVLEDLVGEAAEDSIGVGPLEDLLVLA